MVGTTEISHRPFGFEAPYSAGPDERNPRRPQAGQTVKLGGTTPEKGETTAPCCYWRLNGLAQEPLILRLVGRAPQQVSPFLAVSPLHEVGEQEAARTGENDSQLCWEAEFGPFNFGDWVEYGFEEPGLYPFSFSTIAWRPLALAGNGNLYWTSQAGVSQALGQISLSEKNPGTFQLKLELDGSKNSESKEFYSSQKVEVTAGISDTLATIEGIGENIRLKLANEYGLVMESAAPLLFGLFSVDGTLEALRVNFSAGAVDFYGLGERFDQLNQRGFSPDIRVYEEYKNQGQRTYFPIPFGFSPNGFGLYLDTGAYSRFFLPEDASASFEVELADKTLDIYFFIGTPPQILSAYTALTGKPVLPPAWIFSPWMSGNEWNSQAKVMEQVEKSAKLGVATGVLVIEAWADETTFYVLNDADYAPRDPATPPRLSDFHFPADGHWPDPKGMIEELHRRGIKVLLWQIPVLKSFGEVERDFKERAAAGQEPQTAGLEQHRWDVAYALEQGYVVRDGQGQPYRNPGIWFHDAYILDITNPQARQWWMARREYLVKELGIDGFKTDGGEHLWGLDLAFSDGRKGQELINLYPRLYSQMYYDALQEWREDGGITFSRAGYAGSQNSPCHWAGDENSTFAAFRHSVIAGLSAGLSGIPFWGWDIGGFSGPMPTAELYLRAASMALFCPIMQYHSEYFAHRKPPRDRTPWNVAEHDNSPWLVEAYAKLTRLRLELIPYLEKAAANSAATGEPIMRALVFDWPSDPVCRNIADQYLFGPMLLVAPVMEEGAVGRDIYLPEGQWRDWWEGASSPLVSGPCWLENYSTPLLEKPCPVFEKVSQQTRLG